MDEEFTDMLLMEEMNIEEAVAATPAPASFVPSETKQKQKNRDKKRSQRPAKAVDPEPNVVTSTIRQVPPSPAVESAAPQVPSSPVQAPTQAPVDEVKALFAAFDDIQDSVPDLFESSAKIVTAAQAILPIPNAIAVVGVAAVAGLAAYLTLRRQA